jgi:hypothetical protein
MLICSKTSEAVQEKFNNVVGEEEIEPEGKIDFD